MSSSTTMSVRTRALLGTAALLALLAVVPATLTLAAPAGEPPASSATIEELPEPPAVAARSWAVYDGVDGTRLAGAGATDEAPIASLTKLMTALVVTKRTRGDEQVPVSRRATQVADGAALGLRAGQKYPLDTLLQAMLVYSANDAAIALAEYVGSDLETFIGMMNDEADALDLGSTRFTSVTGLDAEDVPHTSSSPADIVELATLTMREPRIREAVRMERVTVQRPGAQPLVVQNRNLLLGSYAGVDGMKTGHTDAAGYCLLTHYDDQEGRELWVVILGAKSDEARFDATRALLDWAVPLRQDVPMIAAGDSIGTAPVAGSRAPVELFVSEDVAASVRIGERVKERVIVPSPIEPPLRAGDEVGRIEILVDGEVAAQSPLYVDRQLREPGLLDRAIDIARDWHVALDEGWKELERVGASLRDEAGV